MELFCVLCRKKSDATSIFSALLVCPWPEIWVPDLCPLVDQGHRPSLLSKRKICSVFLVCLKWIFLFLLIFSDFISHWLYQILSLLVQCKTSTAQVFCFPYCPSRIHLFAMEFRELPLVSKLFFEWFHTAQVHPASAVINMLQIKSEGCKNGLKQDMFADASGHCRPGSDCVQILASPDNFFESL